MALLVVAGYGESVAQTGHGALSDEAALWRAPEDGGARRWQVSAPDGAVLYRAPSVTAQQITTVPQAGLLASFGCAEVQGRIWCALRPLGGGARGFMPVENLRPAMGPDGRVPTGPDDSDRRARRQAFDATGEIRCAQERGEALGPCPASVSRSGGGDATVVVRFASGFARRLHFVHGRFLSANATMSGSGTDVDWRIEGKLHIIRVDDQRFHLPDVLVFGE